MMHQPPTSAADAPPLVPPKTSGLAVTSFIFGLLSFCSFGLSGLVSIPTGVAALIGISRSGGVRRGKVFAIFGIALPFFGGAISLVLFGLFAPALNAARSNARTMKWEVQGAQAAQALNIQRYDNNGALAGGDWRTVLVQTGYMTLDLIVPPDGSGPGLALNRALASVDPDTVDAPGRTVLLFETAENGPAVGGPEDLASAGFSGDRVLIVYLDGNTARLTPAQARIELVWTPTLRPEAGDTP